MIKINDKATTYFPNLYTKGIQIVGENISVWENKKEIETLGLYCITSIEFRFLKTEKTHQGYIKQLTNKFFSNKKTNTELAIDVYEIKFNLKDYSVDKAKDTFYIEVNHEDLAKITEEITLFNESVDHTFQLNQKKIISATKHEHDSLIEIVPTLIRELKKLLRKESFNYSLAEIDVFEDFFRANLINPKQVGLTKESLDNLFKAYIATAFFWNFGGKWSLDTDKNSSTYGCTYAETDYDKYSNTSICMVEWIFLIRTGQFDERLASIFDRRIYFYNQNSEVKLKPIRNHY